MDPDFQAIINKLSKITNIKKLKNFKFLNIALVLKNNIYYY